MNHPAVAAAAGAYIKEVCEISIVQCMENGLTDQKKEAKEFLNVSHVNFNKVVT